MYVCILLYILYALNESGVYVYVCIYASILKVSSPRVVSVNILVPASRYVCICMSVHICFDPDSPSLSISKYLGAWQCARVCVSVHLCVCSNYWYISIRCASLSEIQYGCTYIAPCKCTYIAPCKCTYIAPCKCA